MTKLGDQPESGLFEARYVAFLETVTHLRPQLHRYCARMTGSPTEGEDVMQEALFDAYRKLDTIVEGRALAPWLFTIAHNRCIDTLRRRKFRARAEAAAAQPDRIDATEPVGVVVGPALERMVIHLPPKERACLLLKDVFDHQLGAFVVTDVRQIFWIVHSVSQVPDQYTTNPQRGHSFDGERSIQDAHVGMYAHDQ